MEGMVWISLLGTQLTTGKMRRARTYCLKDTLYTQYALYVVTYCLNSVCDPFLQCIKKTPIQQVVGHMDSV
jgi:hypothetical protein